MFSGHIGLWHKGLKIWCWKLKFLVCADFTDGRRRRRRFGNLKGSKIQSRSTSRWVTLKAIWSGAQRENWILGILQTRTIFVFWWNCDDWWTTIICILFCIIERRSWSIWNWWTWTSKGKKCHQNVGGLFGCRMPIMWNKIIMVDGHPGLTPHKWTIQIWIGVLWIILNNVKN